MYYVYLLKDKVKNQTYIGYTNDLKRRLGEHEANKRPVLIYYEAYRSRADAMQRERLLKQRGQTVRRLKERLVHSFG